MNNTLAKGLIFVVGAAIGAGTTYVVLNKKFSDRAEAEISEMREYYKNKLNDISDDTEEATEDVEEESPKVVATQNHEHSKPNDIREYKTIIENEGYTNYSGTDVRPDKKDSSDDGPEIITPEEFGDNEDYNQVTLVYYAGDDQLTYKNGDLVDDVDELVGWDNIGQIGKYEDDALYIRNDEHKTYYEILQVEDSWSGQ